MQSKEDEELLGLAQSKTVAPTKTTEKNETVEKPIEDQTKDRFAASAQKMATNSGAGESTADAAGKLMMMSGNPYAAGAGLGLMTYASIKNKREQEKQQQYQNRADALQNLANWSRTIRSL